MMEGVAVQVKEEVQPKMESTCLACGALGTDIVDAYSTTLDNDVSLYTFLCKFCTSEDLTVKETISKYICRSCHNLLLLLYQAEQDYKRLKQCFEEILAKNPLFSSSISLTTTFNDIKTENDAFEVMYSEEQTMDMDSEDEPLAIAKKKRKKEFKKKKKPNTKSKVKKKCESEVIKDDDAGGRDLGDLNNSVENNGEDLSKDIKIEDSVSENRTENKRRKRQTHHCDHCKATFTSIARLEKHLAAHGAGPPYVCEVCGAAYKHRRACDIHVAMHKGISEWRCEPCDRPFPSKGALLRHNNIHTGKPNYQCDQCGKSFIHTSSFKMHALAHSGEKPHACAVCGLRLMTSSHLKRHLRVHSGEKRFHCPHTNCQKRFSERYNLVAHLRSHEAPAGAGARGEEAGAEPQGAGEGEGRAHIDEPPLKYRHYHFRCHFCAERYERRHMLERHMSAAHGRTLERAAPRPRNTMSKLLKAQAQLLSRRDESRADSAPAARDGDSPAYTHMYSV